MNYRWYRWFLMAMAAFMFTGVAGFLYWELTKTTEEQTQA
jgi:hypothetical protein